MLEKIAGLEKMTIHQCQELAQKFGFDSTEFDLVGPKGRLHAKWIDAYLGFFQIDGHEGFNMVSQFSMVPDLHCENLMPVDKSSNAAVERSAPSSASASNRLLAEDDHE